MVYATGVDMSFRVVVNAPAGAKPAGEPRPGLSKLASLVSLALVLAACIPPGDDVVDAGADEDPVTATTVAESGSGTDDPSDEVDRAGGVASQVAMVHSAGTQLLGPDDAPLDLRCVNVDGWLWPTVYLQSDSGNGLFISTAEFVNRLDDVVDPARADRFWKDWRDNFFTEADVERMADLGINCARLVIYYRAIATIENGEPVFNDVLTYVDSAVEWGEKHGVYMVLDLHAAPGGQNGVATVADVPSTDLVARLWEGPDAQANQDATVSIWRFLAERYANEPWVAGYDLLNEPALPEGSGSDLVDLYARIIATIRSVDAGHMVIVEGDDFATDFSEFTEPLDDNLMYEFHAYALTPFSEWAVPEQQDLQPFLTLREEHNRPIWLGEFGEGTEGWIEAMVDLMEENDVGWALFPWKRKQTWFFNPVLQRIGDMPQWYAVAAYLAQPPNGSVPRPSVEEAEEGMAQAISKIQLADNTEDRSLAGAILDP